MDAHLIFRIIAGVGAVVVGWSALTSLRSEWPKTELDDHVTKVMLILLTLGCILVLLFSFGVVGRVGGEA